VFKSKYGDHINRVNMGAAFLLGLVVGLMVCLGTEKLNEPKPAPPAKKATLLPQDHLEAEQRRLYQKMSESLSRSALSPADQAEVLKALSRHAERSPERLGH
jgi:hypothetical protein